MTRPTLTAEERQQVRVALRAHPDIFDHVRALSEVNILPEKRILEIVDALGIDLDDARSGLPATPATADNDLETDDKPFSGAIEYDIDFQVGGRNYRHTLIAEYSWRPAWPYLDVITHTERVATMSSAVVFMLSEDERATSTPASPVGRPLDRRAPFPKVVELEDGLPPLQFGTPFCDDLFAIMDGEAKRTDVARRSAYANVVPLRSQSQAGLSLEPMANVIESVTTALQVMGMAYDIRRCGDHWHATIFESETGKSDDELDFVSHAQTKEGAMYDLCWAMALHLKSQSEG